MKISDSGKTIIFVSHNLNSVRSLCKTAILLDKGSLLLKDNVDNVISEYLALNKNTVSFFDKSKNNIGNEPIKVIDSKIICSDQSFKRYLSSN